MSEKAIIEVSNEWDAQDLKPMLTHTVTKQWSAAELAKAVAEASSFEQAEFFLRFAEEALKFPWSMQCRHIADAYKNAGHLVGPHITSTVICVLDSLVEHLREGVAK